ncbi:ABC transporter ATP-binding protein [Lentiprolixibacter aurantiacus]|uniref:ABC transporter ATP-binding protein n=1 Tax=Lentiprolixibacter aurantiacus TaxID=2993939 RepID=UPI00272B494A|nr:ABC transporter ATP-binding protein [Lentiprolixibacter aurantiacus]
MNFTIKCGELTAIVGANGIGKSTLLRTLGRIQPALNGSILLDEKPVSENTVRELSRKIGVVLTEPLSSRNITVTELIALGRQPYTNWIGSLSAVDLGRVREVITLMGLEPLKNKKCFELSDGQLQKALIGRALAQDTDLLLLDEPTTHLDLYHKAQILKTLQGVAHNSNKIIVFTTHELDLAIQLCDRMLILGPEGYYFGEPCELISQKNFETLFPSDLVRFDAKTGTFKIQ